MPGRGEPLTGVRRLFPQTLRWAAAPVFAVVCMSVVGAWMLRNQQVAGHFAISDQGGVVLAYFKASEVTLFRNGRTEDRYLETTLDPARADLPHKVWSEIDQRLRSKFPDLPPEKRRELSWRNLAQGNKTDVDSFAISGALAEIGWSDLAVSPMSTLACCLTRCASMLTFPINLALKPPAGVEINRLESFAKGVPYLLLVSFVVVRLVRRRLHFHQVFFPLACTVALLSATTPQLDPRFRVPLIPLLLAIAFLPNGHRTSPPRGQDS